MAQANEVFDKIAATIAGKLESGVRPWSKPWTARGSALALPRNIEGRAYRGANTFWLWMEQEAKGYAEPVWMTFKQAKARGGSVRKGEKGTPVFFWSRTTKEDAATGETTSRFFAKVYTVFNIAQCEGVELPEAAPASILPEAERIAAADALIVATGAEVRHGGSKAFYTPTFDRIHLPAFADFINADGYYSTAFHELGHWTGAEHRLNRTFGREFGDEAYAFEELVAELTAAFVCASQGFASVERDDHAAYIGHWAARIRSNPKAFIQACTKAQTAADYILKAAEADAAQEPQGEAAEALALAA
ncbi:DNA primase [Brevundimonas phage vB_BpoS-Kikimora]|uniref:DNA primase n=1 Tax=Brevundimonas phage vB_BpoS-Kikimora TaxID=2948601 RepID=A0A9E7MT33_9CAUD|nr:DNA primase [Brevundimonas phage vB_BpoS-Kikimora]